MSYYDEVYLKRLNRYGLDYQSRIQGQRERNFDDYLLKTLFRVDFEYNNKVNAASLERYKQDYVETQAYLLTKRDVEIPSGTIIEITNQSGDKALWMIWWLENIASSGYNKYVVLKMTRQFTWQIGSNTYTQWGYFKGSGTSMIQDTDVTSGAKTLFTENDNKYMFITPYNATLTKEVYCTIVGDTMNQAFMVLQNDNNSTPGISYVSLDPTLVRYTTPPNQSAQTTQSSSTGTSYWLNGGNMS